MQTRPFFFLSQILKTQSPTTWDLFCLLLHFGLPAFASPAIQLLPPLPPSQLNFHFLLHQQPWTTTTKNYLLPPLHKDHITLLSTSQYLLGSACFWSRTLRPNTVASVTAPVWHLSQESTNHHSTAFWIITQIRWLVDLSSWRHRPLHWHSTINTKGKAPSTNLPFRSARHLAILTTLDERPS